MAEEAAAATATETPATPVEGQATETPANDGGTKAPANDNAKPAEGPTEEEVFALVEKFGTEKALKILTARLKYEFDGTSVLPSERAAFREERRKAKAALDERQREIETALQEKVTEATGDIEFGRAVRAAYEAGDYDGVARALGKAGWDGIQEDYIARLADPNHKRLTELERKLQEKEQNETRQREQFEAQQRQAQQRQAQAAYKQQLSAEMKASSNQMLSALGDFPDVVNMVFAVQSHAYQTEGIALTPEQAMRRPLPGGSVAIQLILEQWHGGLSKAFAAAQAEKPAPAAPKAKGKTDAKPAISPSGGHGTENEREYIRRGAAAMEEAFRREAELADLEQRRKGNSAARQ